jgi:hypothetical protein
MEIPELYQLKVGLSVKKDDEEDLIGVIKSKDGGYHSHLIYRLKGTSGNSRCRCVSY